MLDIQDRMVRYLYRITDDDHYVLEVYDLVAGDNYKVVEIAFTRKK